ncbi:MAG TPA: TRAM domain-containing protein, partial [Oscillospiraceae bacterium]|nr:TRAM domain-containing protein [Oscillospiraceae bacterium]
MSEEDLMDINIGDTVQGEIIDFTHEGKGVLKYNNLIIFVNGGLIGDIVKAEINKVKKNFAMASIIKIIKPSKDRVNFDLNTNESRGGIPLIEYR